MKLSSFAATLIAAAIGIIVAGAPSSAATLATWTFETSAPTTAGPHAAEVGTGTAIGFHAGATAYSNPVGNGSAESFSSTVWAVGDFYEFSALTAGATDFDITWDQVSSSTGPADFSIQYSTDGISFTPINNYVVLANSSPNQWSSGAPVLTTSYAADIDGLSASTIYFRMVNTSAISANGGTVAAGGTNRIDNVSIAAVPEPATLALAGMGLIGMVAARRRS